MGNAENIKLDKEAVLKSFSPILREIRESIGLSVDRLGTITDIDREKLKAVENGERKLLWNEYMSILYIFWRNEKGRKLIEEKGLFPEELKEIMTINKKAHD